MVAGIARNPSGFGERKRFLSLGDGHRVKVGQEGRYDPRSINVRGQPDALGLPSTPYGAQFVTRHSDIPRVVGPIPHVPLRGDNALDHWTRSNWSDYLGPLESSTKAPSPRSVIE